MATYLVNFISIVLGLLVALVAALFYFMGSADSGDHMPILKTNLSIEQFWVLDYDGMIPAELKLPGTLVAENRDGLPTLSLSVFSICKKKMPIRYCAVSRQILFTLIITHLIKSLL